MQARGEEGPKGMASKHRSGRKGVARGVAWVAALVGMLGAVAPGQLQASERPAFLKVGIVTFLSGPSAGPFGVPARNAAEILIEHMNAGKLPAPYGTAGIGGVPVRPVFVDEAGDAVTKYRQLVREERVDVVIGYISSANCLAVAPVAEELKQLTVLFDCGTPRVFEESRYRYVFRTAAHAGLDSIAAARYVLAVKPDLRSISGINQNYAWGQDSWSLFEAAVRQLKPDVRVVRPQFPTLFSGQYAAEISALLAGAPDVIHSSFWGGDLEAFLIQARPRGLFSRSTVVFSAGETAVPRLRRQMPEGVIVGSRGSHGLLAPRNPLSEWFDAAYEERFGVVPVYPSYHMAQALLGLKAAYEKALARLGRWPEQEEVIEAFEHLEFDTPSGPVAMAIGGGHQAVESATYGTLRFNRSTGQNELADIQRFGPACVNPPEGMSTSQWIAAGFPGARCP